MSDTTALNIPPEKPMAQPPQSTNITLNQTRTYLWEFLLSLSTASIYSIFYLMCRTHELNKIGGKKFTPWLWFFSLSPFISFFSLPRLHRVLNVLEAKHQSPHPSKWNLVTVVAIILSSLYLGTSYHFSTPIWADLMVLFIWSAFFALFAQRISALKHAIANVEWNPEHKVKKGVRWLFSIIVVPLYLIGAGSELYQLYQLRGAKQFEANETYVISEDGKVKLTFVQEGWYQAEVGSFSDGSADAEFGGPNFSSNMILFIYNNLDSIDTHLYGRQEWLKEAITNAECQQSKHLIDNTLVVKSTLICKGTFWDEKKIGVSTVLEHNGKFYEIIGVYSALEHEFLRNSRDFYQMIKEFKPV